jgi:hypothetical protein
VSAELRTRARARWCSTFGGAQPLRTPPSLNIIQHVLTIDNNIVEQRDPQLICDGDIFRCFISLRSANWQNNAKKDSVRHLEACDLYHEPPAIIPAQNLHDVILFIKVPRFSDLDLAWQHPRMPLRICQYRQSNEVVFACPLIARSNSWPQDKEINYKHNEIQTLKSLFGWLLYS